MSSYSRPSDFGETGFIERATIRHALLALCHSAARCGGASRPPAACQDLPSSAR
ncbi:hypothetical protein HMPREF9946_05124 [Acetobacteraceae bacterium AT-5844]|nr:hypothetical protein HMPREF9946_05124 [Acetobacteraceae bacterium AT-5844]